MERKKEHGVQTPGPLPTGYGTLGNDFITSEMGIVRLLRGLIDVV